MIHICSKVKKNDKLREIPETLYSTDYLKNESNLKIPVTYRSCSNENRTRKKACVDLEYMYRALTWARIVC